MLERIIKNWKTSSAAIVALVVAIAAWYGTDLDGTLISELLAAIYGILLLFAKD